MRKPWHSPFQKYIKISYSPARTKRLANISGLNLKWITTELNTLETTTKSCIQSTRQWISPRDEISFSWQADRVENGWESILRHCHSKHNHFTSHWIIDNYRGATLGVFNGCILKEKRGQNSVHKFSYWHDVKGQTQYADFLTKVMRNDLKQSVGFIFILY